MFKYSSKGNWKNTFDYLDSAYNSEEKILNILEKKANEAITELKQNTPRDTGLTANSWSFTITNKNNRYEIIFNNSNLSKGIPVVVLLEYGHVTKNGIWIESRPFINTSLDPIFYSLTEKLREELS